VAEGAAGACASTERGVRRRRGGWRSQENLLWSPTISGVWSSAILPPNLHYSRDPAGRLSAGRMTRAKARRDPFADLPHPGVKARCTFPASGSHCLVSVPNAILLKVNALMTPNRTIERTTSGKDGSGS